MKAAALLLMGVVLVGASPDRSDLGEAERGVLGCVSPYVKMANACYMFHQRHLSRQQASAQCGREGAVLASVTTQSQYNALLSHMNKNFPGTYWTSGMTDRGRWVWESTGQSMNSAWWGTSPSTAANQCAYFCSNTHKYWAKSCGRSIRFICEAPLTLKIDVRAE